MLSDSSSVCITTDFGIRKVSKEARTMVAVPCDLQTGIENEPIIIKLQPEVQPVLPMVSACPVKLGGS